MRESAPKTRLARPKILFIPRTELADREKEMCALAQSLVQVTEAEFHRGFESATLYACYFLGEQLVGFSSVMEASLFDGRRNVFTIGLGQTVVDPRFRNHFLVQRALIFRWWRRFMRRPFRPICIWGVCTSYKPYLAFSKTLHIVYPHRARSIPPHHQNLLNAIGSHWYGEAFSKETGLAFLQGIEVTDPLSKPKAEDLLDADIAFFHAKAKMTDQGTWGLLTISPCEWGNLLPMLYSWGRNLIRKTLGLKRKKLTGSPKSHPSQHPGIASF